MCCVILQDTFFFLAYIMRLRIRHAEGMATLSDVNQEDTVSMLKDAIRNAISLDAAQDIQSKNTRTILPFCHC